MVHLVNWIAEFFLQYGLLLGYFNFIDA